MEAADTYQSVGPAHVSEHPARMHRHDQDSCSKDRLLTNLYWKNIQAEGVKKFARGIADTSRQPKGKISMGQFKITGTSE